MKSIRSESKKNNNFYALQSNEIISAHPSGKTM